MPKPTLSVYVDLNDDGDFVDANEDISAYVESADVSLGFAAPFDPACKDSTARLLLRNDSKRFSPESGSVFSANWTVGKKVKITATDPAGPTTYTMAIGWIKEIDPTPAVWGDRVCAVMITGFNDRAFGAECFVPIQISQTADSIIATIVQYAAVYPPGIPVRWMLGIPGRSELESTTYMGSTTDWLSADVGKTTFAYVGDQWRNGASEMGAIADICAQEYGRFWVGRDGLANFINRTHLILDTTVDATYAGTFDALAYTYGNDVINRVTVKARPRKVGNSPEVLGRVDGAFVVPASGTFTQAFRYADLVSSGASIAGQNVIAPVRTTDFTANSAADGTGTDYTSSVTATIAQETSTRTQVLFTNAAVVPVYIQAGAQIRGTAIRDFGLTDFTYDDTNSQTSYGLHPHTYPVTVDTLAQAEGIARMIGTSRQTPRGSSRSVTFYPNQSAALLTSVMSLSIFNRITITETQTGASKDYWIISEAHSWANGADDYAVTWGLEPSGSSQYWVLGVAGFSELETTTWMGPF